MGKEQVLKESYQKTDYKFNNHGPRNVDVLKQAIASVNGLEESDIYGTGKLIEDFEDQMANVLGKEKAVFFPSGTMAQQIALRIWCDEKQLEKVAYHPFSHLEIHEEEGLKKIHGIQTVLLGDEDRLFTLKDLMDCDESIACLLIELPQREIGGQLPSFEELEAIAAYCRNNGIRLHLDGARLWECLPFYQKTAAEICSLFDSVYVSFYKGIGGVAGAILAGSEVFTTESKIWKRRYGGDLISLYPYVISADYYYKKRADQMPVYYKKAQEIAERFNQSTGIQTIPRIPVTNMFHVHFQASAENMAPILIKLHETYNIGISGMLKENNKGNCSFEMTIGDDILQVSESNLAQVFTDLDHLMKELNTGEDMQGE